ncbi:hypothetical protein [Actinocorallia libanotica]|uniref:Dephospho-CoA kinase n=1 Tax=Actinocorallia libanotica TaxID=46162 RepID=A0ABN1QR88_9ACTN
MTTPLIGLSGYAGSGKDAVADALERRGWERAAFADRMREFLMLQDPSVPTPFSSPVRLSSLVRMYGWDSAKRTFPEVRALLQRTGTEAGRGVLGEDVWVNALLGPWDGRPLVVSDVRFPNEAQRVRDLGGVVVRVVRPGVEPGRTAHRSETALDEWPFDAVIENSGSLGDLSRAVSKLLTWADLADHGPNV